MIKFEHTDVHGFEAAIRGMRNSWNSWDKSDSHICLAEYGVDCAMAENGHEPAKKCHNGDFNYCIGENDLSLMQKLIKAGTDHSKFMRMIDVSVDITAPLYWWKQFDQYHIGVTTNSTSTMHCIADKEFTLDDFSYEHLYEESSLSLYATVCILNVIRQDYLETKDKKYWWEIIQLLPSSYNQKRTVHLNYQVLRNIYFARRNHKLDEWVSLCEWIKTLPYSELITEV